ncbi:hypothetical protein AKO1_005324 [Acrasis kona]|uniref:Uncharacterized protein n=1 Tax=Acrasis kona TaxID=1008807 RepID=A0AAW2YMT5_9EUKA
MQEPDTTLQYFTKTSNKLPDHFFDHHLSDQFFKEKNSSIPDLNCFSPQLYEEGIEQIFQPLLDLTPNFLFDTPTTLSYEDLFHCDQQPSSPTIPSTPPTKTIPPSPVKKPTAPTQDNTWITVYDTISGPYDVEIQIKTRREKPISTVPDILYSSLKYELLISASGDFVREVPFLLARFSVVDAETFKPVCLENGKSVMRGEDEGALTHTPTGPKDLIKGSIRVQFDSSISYHHAKRELCVEMSLFENEALQTPIFTKRTPPVKMYARKPNKKKIETSAPSTSVAKRKREDEPAIAQKIARVQVSEGFTEFSTRLDDLVLQSQAFSFEEKQRATALVLSKFGLSLPLILASQNPHSTLFY